MPMWTMNLRGLSAGKDLAGVTQERPLPLKSRAQCVPHTVCRAQCAAHACVHRLRFPSRHTLLVGGRTLCHL